MTKTRWNRYYNIYPSATIVSINSYDEEKQHIFFQKLSGQCSKPWGSKDPTTFFHFKNVPISLFQPGSTITPCPGNQEEIPIPYEHEKPGDKEDTYSVPCPKLYEVRASEREVCKL